MVYAAKVLLYIEKKIGIENLNGFLGWLVSLNDPFSVFQKSASVSLVGVFCDMAGSMIIGRTGKPMPQFLGTEKSTKY